MRRFHLQSHLFILNIIFLHLEYGKIQANCTDAMFIPRVLLHNTMCCVSNREAAIKTLFSQREETAVCL